MANNGSPPYMTIREAVEDHEMRLRKMEGWMKALPLTLVSSIIAAVAAIAAALK